MGTDKVLRIATNFKSPRLVLSAMYNQTTKGLIVTLFPSVSKCVTRFPVKCLKAPDLFRPTVYWGPVRRPKLIDSSLNHSTCVPDFDFVIYFELYSC